MAATRPPACIHVDAAALKRLTSKEPGSTSAIAKEDAPRFVYELCWRVAEGELTAAQFVQALALSKISEVLQGGPLEAEGQVSPKVASLLADTLWIVSLEVEAEKSKLTRVAVLAKQLVLQSKLLSLQLLRERCELEFLDASGLLPSGGKEAFKRKEIRVNTRLRYEQRRFNLLREESEGYAKLVCALCDLGEATEANAEDSVIPEIQSLIGYFDLDPNRVFDLVLEAMELQQAATQTYLKLISLFRVSNLPHIVGFRYRSYVKQGKPESTAKSLHTMTAKLLEQGLLKLDDIFPHLEPSDEEAKSIRAEDLKRQLNKAKKIGVVNLKVTGEDAVKEAERKKEEETKTEEQEEAAYRHKRQSNQKLGLTAAAIEIGAWDVAKELLTKAKDHDPVSFPPICEALTKLVENSVNQSYSVLLEKDWVPATQRQMKLAGQGEAGELDIEDGESMEVDTKATEVKEEPVSKKLRTDNATDSKAPLKSASPLTPIVIEAVPYIGYNLCKDVPLFVKLCRLCRLHIRKGEAAQREVENLLEKAVLPALSLIPASPANSSEVWDVMKLLPYQSRFRLYGQWRDVCEGDLFPALNAAHGEAIQGTKKVLRRISKENTKQMGRSLCKIAHSRPMAVMRTIIQLLENYANLIQPVVDMFKYLTGLGYDVIAFVVIEHLASPGRDKLKDDGMHVSSWLQSLAVFCGHLWKKYTGVQLEALIQYIVNQLKDGQSLDLLVLKELIARLCNVEALEDVSDAVLQSFAGGETLRNESQPTTQGLSRTTRAINRGYARLREALMPSQGEHLAFPLLVLICQERNSIIFNSDTHHLKLIGELYDKCQETFIQYVDFLLSAVTPLSAYSVSLPPLVRLVRDFKLDPEVAFHLYRPMLSTVVGPKGLVGSTISDASKGNSQAGTKRDRDGTEKESSGRQDSAAGDEGKGSADPEKTQGLVQSEDEAEVSVGHRKMKWSALLGEVRCILPGSTWKSISEQLYLTFWSLSLYDLHVPRERYQQEIEKNQFNLRTLENTLKGGYGSEPLPQVELNKKRKEKERVEDTIKKLQSELEEQEQHVKKVAARLENEKDTWFGACSDRQDTVTQLLQTCVLPRCSFTNADALYCAKFVEIMHKMGTPYFSTLQYYDKTLKDLHQLVFRCTQHEAGRLGRFLHETLKTLDRWRSSEQIYLRECSSLPGFGTSFLVSANTKRASYSDFVRVNFKWHSRLAKGFIQCLQSKDFMEIRNALVVLTKLAGVFPVIKKFYQHIEKHVASIKEEDERGDLKVLATRYLAQLQTYKKQQVLQDDFLQKEPSKDKEKTLAKESGKDEQGEVGDEKSQKETEPASGNPVKQNTVAKASKTKTAKASEGKSAKDLPKEKTDPSAGSTKEPLTAKQQSRANASERERLDRGERDRDRSDSRGDRDRNERDQRSDRGDRGERNERADRSRDGSSGGRGAGDKSDRDIRTDRDKDRGERGERASPAVAAAAAVVAAAVGGNPATSSGGKEPAPGGNQRGGSSKGGTGVSKPEKSTGFSDRPASRNEAKGSGIQVKNTAGNADSGGPPGAAGSASTRKASATSAKAEGDVPRKGKVISTSRNTGRGSIASNAGVSQPSGHQPPPPPPKGSGDHSMAGNKRRRDTKDESKMAPPPPPPPRDGKREMERDQRGLREMPNDDGGDGAQHRHQRRRINRNDSGGAPPPPPPPYNRTSRR